MKGRGTVGGMIGIIVFLEDMSGEVAGNMGNKIVYSYGNGIYVNITNKCSNKCEFCVRQMTDGLGDAESLWLETEPTSEQVTAELEKYTLEHEEVVFCGYGEPMERLDAVLEVCRYLKEHHDTMTRVNTNGLADLINGKPTAHMLKGLVDSVSISLNEADPQSYLDLCHPCFGIKSYEAILKYIEDVKQYVNHVGVSVVGCIPEEDIRKCMAIAEKMDVEFKLR